MTLRDVLGTVPARVQAGIKWLNTNEPGWLRKIDLPRLNMAQGGNCIGGQLDSSFCDFKDRHELETEGFVPLGFVSHMHVILPGRFDWKHVEDEYAALTDAWRSAIAELRKEQS